MLTETCIYCIITDAELGLSDFYIFPRDRNEEITSKSRNGGILITNSSQISDYSKFIDIAGQRSEELLIAVETNKFKNFFVARGARFTSRPRPRASCYK